MLIVAWCGCCLLCDVCCYELCGVRCLLLRFFVVVCRVLVVANWSCVDVYRSVCVVCVLVGVLVVVY